MLQRGDDGDFVREAQELLQRFGAQIPDAPGHFGVWTEAAIYSLQRAAGLFPDGVIGPQTDAVLRAGSRPAGFPSGSPIVSLVEVPYLSQRDNEHRPLATCNVTSLAMALRYHGAAAHRDNKQLEDELFEQIHSPEGMAAYAERSPVLHKKGVPPEEVFDNLVWLAQERGFTASFSEDRTLLDIESELLVNRPVLLSGTFTGSGHIIVLVGLCKSGDFIVNDPFGDWNHNYNARYGQARIYARDKMLAILKNPDRVEKCGLFIDRA